MRKQNKFKTVVVFLLLQCVLLTNIAFAQFGQQPKPEAPKPLPKLEGINGQIQDEGMNRSQVMRTLHFLSDVYGARLTGSPNHKAAADWVVRQMNEWKMDNAALEPWDFGHPGWINERASGFMLAPAKDNLTFEVLAWTPGTKGAVTGEVFQMILPERPTQEELTAYFNEVKGKVSGKMVLMGKPAVIPVNFNPQNKRIDDETLKRRLDPNAAPPQFTPPPQPTPKPNQLTGLQIAEQIDKFLLDSGVLVRINDAGREHGQIRAFNNRTFDETKVVPTVVMRNEDFGRIARILNDGSAVSLEFDIRNKSFPEGKTSYNVVGEIAGTDKKDEVIMLGGHLDSWHAATGATDNAIGCAIMLEAARILKALNLKPRRTIRVALWSGEEQGLLGSQAYVKKHFGTFEMPTANYEKFGGYFNIDSGTGRARGLGVFGPAETSAILRDIVAPFTEYGIAGAVSGKNRGLGGSDHTSFNNAGLPGIGVMQDPIEYGTHTWHTNLDTYERIVEDDVKKSAVIVAAAVYALAMRDELLPRFKKEEMPKPVVEQ